MLQRLIAFSLKQPATVLWVALFVVGLAAFWLPQMPVDVFPELNAPTVVVLTEAPGSRPTRSNRS